MPATAPVRLVFASANAGKLRELAALLAPRGFELVTQASLGVPSPEETGATFAENALLKARHAAVRMGCAAIADDSGIEVDALGGRPGVRSARYAGEDATDERNNVQLLAELQGVPHARRTARYRCVIVLVNGPDDAQPLIAEGAWEGTILQSPRGTGGFGYDPLFLPAGSALTAAELAPEVKNSVSHRGQALRALLAQLDARVRTG